jgi:hypothetical protein
LRPFEYLGQTLFETRCILETQKYAADAAAAAAAAADVAGAAADAAAAAGHNRTNNYLFRKF